MTSSNSPDQCPVCGQLVPPNTECSDCESDGKTLPSLASETGSSWKIGPTIRYFGDYEILGEVARGGMGVVYKARQASLNRIVAIKMILSARLADEMAIRRFHVEAEAAAKLQHPNIVGVHEVGEYDGQHYFSMDYVDGRSLGQLIKQGPLPASLAASYTQRLARAMQFAHDRGVLHRDLKPSNVIIDHEGRPRITDFGLAKIESDIDDLTKSGSILGSVHYMAPEQASGRVDAIGVRSDVYSLGAMLYEMLTGRPPHKAATIPATLQQVMDEVPVSIRKVSPATPTELEIIVMKCLEKSPARRYASSGELASDLERFLSKKPIQAREASWIQKAETQLGRNPWAIAGFLTLALIALLFVAYGLRQQNLFTLWKTDPGTNPGLPSGFESRLNQWMFRGQALLYPVFAIFLFHQKHSRGLRWTDYFGHPHKFFAAEEKPVSPRLHGFMIGTGSLAGLYGLYLATQVIKAQIWEATIHTPLSLMAPTLVMLGVFTVEAALRNRRLGLYGAPIVADEPMPGVIREEILENSTPSAMALYHTMRPDLAMNECRATVQRWAHQMHEADPKAFEKPTRTNLPARLLLQGMTVVTLLLFVAAYTIPITAPAWWLLAALCGTLFVLPICRDAKTFQQKILIYLPPVIAFATLRACAEPMGHDNISMTGFITGLASTAAMHTLAKRVNRKST